MIYTVTLNPSLDKEYQVPQLAFNQVLRAAQVNKDMGGKGFNVSRMLALLGADTCAMGLVGGQTGIFLKEGLKTLGIITEMVCLEQESRTNISIVDKEGRYIKVNEEGPLITEDEIDRLIDIISDRAAVNDWWVLAGSLPHGLPADSYARMIETIQLAGGRVALDTSGQPLRLGCRARPCLVKPNLEEAASLAGIEAQDIQQAAALLQPIHELGAQNVVISAGKQGALFSDGKGAWQADAPAIKESNPTGAGDAMLAGLVYYLADSYPPAETLAFAVACGSATASLPGTAMPTRQQVEDLRKEIKTYILTR